VVLHRELERLQAQGITVAFRGDAAFAKPEVYAALEARAAKYAIRLPASDNVAAPGSARSMTGSPATGTVLTDLVGHVSFVACRGTIHRTVCVSW
jgi:hypothetical protein